MRLNNKMLMWAAIGLISFGNINVFAENIAEVETNQTLLTKQNGQKLMLSSKDQIKVILDEDIQKRSRVKVDVNGTYGYVDRANIQLKQIQTKTIVNNAELKKEPKAYAETVTKLAEGTTITAYYKYKSWYVVSLKNGQQGFIYQTQVDEAYLYLLQRKTTYQSDNLLDRADIKKFSMAKNVAEIAEKTAVITTENNQALRLNAGDRIKVLLDESFYLNNRAQVDMNGTYGYINKSEITLKEIETEIIEDNVNLRTTPNLNGQVLEKLNKKDKVVTYYKYMDWYAVKSESGKKGFIYKAQINEDNLYLLERKKDYKASGTKSKASASPAQPVTLMQSSASKSGETEVIQWSSANKLIPRGTVVTIEDVYTGKHFQVKRTFGTNHADVEALTSDDTAVMKQIWGGFSWERHPVIVHIAGRKLAASMAGMPHAGKDSAPNLAYTGGLSDGYGYGQNLDAVKGNGMSGVCDLHFRGSTKHKDGNISATPDPRHQAAISIAAKYNSNW